MSASNRVNVSDFIDRNRLSRVQLTVIILCGLVATLDGFDLQSISFVAPVVSKMWALKPTEMGSVFSAGLFGLMIGALVSGPIADRIGRRGVVIFSAFAFGLFSLLTVLSGNVHELTIYRFLTGLGLGGSMPNIIALTAEYSPLRIRKTMVSTMFCGVPVGAVLGGLLATSIIPTLGWKSLFYLGGIIPIVLGFVLIGGIPESIRFLVAKDVQSTQSAKIVSVLRKINPSEPMPANPIFYLPERKFEGMPVKHLLGPGYAANTILLWIVFFMNLFITYFVSNWMPTVLHKAGLPLSKAIIGVVLLEAGGVIGGIFIGRWGDKRSLKAILVWAFFLNAIALVLISFTSSVGMLMLMIFIAGLLFVGAQFGINALAATIYPTAVRSTGVGWALGIGRIGSILGPIIGGIILVSLGNVKEMFLIAAVPSVLGGIALMFMRTSKVEETVLENDTAMGYTS